MEIPESHSGETLAREFEDLLRQFHIIDKVSNYNLCIYARNTYRICQLSHLTTDSASANSALVNALSTKIASFPGAMNHVRCFDHIISLSAKSVLAPFDVGEGRQSTSAIDDAEAELLELAEGLEEEDAVARLDGDAEDDGDECEREDDNFEGWVDEVVLLSEEEREELKETVVPVQTVLVKVRLNSARLPFQVCVILTQLAAAKALVCHYPLVHSPPSRLAQNYRTAWFGKPHHASRCSHSMEFYLYHAGVRSGIQRCSGRHYWRPYHEIAKV